jgi:hypothetical protein
MPPRSVVGIETVERWLDEFQNSSGLRREEKTETEVFVDLMKGEETMYYRGNLVRKRLAYLRLYVS